LFYKAAGQGFVRDRKQIKKRKGKRKKEKGGDKMIAIGSDHGGFELKTKVIEHLKEQGIECRDFGTYNLDSCDYPEFGHAVAKAVASGECEKGIVICTTGIGISIAANKVAGIRCGLCHNTTTARLTREHNNANVLAIGAGMVGENVAMDIVDTFLATPFSNGERHQRRIDKIEDLG
jgi:ribose 5-phosphate isomerase B